MVYAFQREDNRLNMGFGLHLMDELSCHSSDILPEHPICKMGAPQLFANCRKVKMLLGGVHEPQGLLEADDETHLWPDVFSLGLHDTAKRRKRLHEG